MTWGSVCSGENTTMSEDATSVHDEVEDMAQMKEALQRAGFLARERPIDNELDSETWTALYMFAGSRGFKWSLEDFEAEDGEIPEDVVEALLDPMGLSFSVGDEEGDLVFAEDDLPAFETIDLANHEVIDLCDKHELNTQKAKAKPRKLADIDTIVLHQTGVKFGVGKKALAKYGPREALHRRFYDVACHVAALTNGDVLLVNPWERYVLHGHGSNKFSIGIEIEGLYPGIEDNPKTVAGGGTATELTKRTIGAARLAVKVAVEECRKLGAPITKIAAHRQFHGSRVTDPGQGLWREVALWAVEELGLSIDYDLAVPNKKDPRKSGLRIPKVWDPSGKCDFRGRDLKE